MQKIPPPPPRNLKQSSYPNRSEPSAQANTVAEKKKIVPNVQPIELGIPDKSSSREKQRVDPPAPRMTLQGPQIKPEYIVLGGPRKSNPNHSTSKPTAQDVIGPERKPIAGKEASKGKTTDMSLSQGYQSAPFFLPKTPPRNTKDRDTQSVLRKPRKPKQPPFPHSEIPNARAMTESGDKQTPKVNALNTEVSQVFGNGCEISINFLPQNTKPQNRPGRLCRKGRPGIETATDNDTPDAVADTSTASSRVHASCSGTALVEAIDPIRDNHQRHLIPAGTMSTIASHSDRHEHSARTLSAVAAKNAVSFDRLAFDPATQLQAFAVSRAGAIATCSNTSVEPGASQEMDSSRFETRDGNASQARRVDISLRVMSDSPLAPTTEPPRYLIAARLRLPPGRLSHLLKYSSDHPLSPANPMAREILATWSAEPGVEKAHTCSTATVRACGSMSQSPEISSLE